MNYEKPISRQLKLYDKIQNDEKMINTIIIGDENSAKHVSELLSEHTEISVRALIENGSKSIDVIHQLRPDLILIHLELEDISGFDVVNKVHLHPPPAIIFISRDERSAVKAFEYHAYDYLVEPITSERIYHSLLKVKELIKFRKQENLQDKLNALFRYIKMGDKQHVVQKSSEKVNHKNANLLPIKLAGKIYFLDIEEIEHISASGYYIEIFVNGKKHLVRQSLHSIYEKLDKDRFVRIHRSVIIPLKFLSEINRSGLNDFSVKMKNETIFKISKTYKKEFFDRFNI
jgi:two-component system LytT family response regulator